MTVKIPLGLGDAVYCQPIIRKLTKKTAVIVQTPHPIIFGNMQNVTATSLDIGKPDLNIKYNHLRNSNDTQFQDLLSSVQMSNVKQVFNWSYGFTDEFRLNELPRILTELNNSKKNMCIIKEPTTAHMHKSTKDFSMAPNIEQMQNFIDENKEQFFFISVGKDEIFKKRLHDIDYDLVNKTTVQDLITLCQLSDLIISQVGHLIPIAQGLKKKVKIFYPGNITDPRLKNMNKKKIES